MTKKQQEPSGPEPSAVHSYTVSLHYDRRLYRQDIAGSIAHARMLARQGIMTDKDAELIGMGLVAIREEIERGEFPWRDELEDLHMNVEARLHERIGEVAGKLHTGRSRNDQVATAMRLYAKEACDKTLAGIRALQGALLKQAEANLTTVLPGYTHLQRAQPVLLAHHLLAYFHMLERDAERFRETRRRADVMPLGSAALAGAAYPLDRRWMAKELGFSAISKNSMDAISDRDFLLDYQAAAAIGMMHLSRLAEELVLWSSEEFGFVRLADAFTTGSSIMPQKRNPDFAELARGKTGRVYGHLVGLLTVLKGLPLTYNRDLQEDKEGFFDTADTLQATLEVFAPMIESMTVRAERMRQATEAGYMLATDLADYLARRGVPFRKAHGIVAELTKYAAATGKTYQQLSLEEYKKFSPDFAADVLEITEERSLAARDVPGGTAPERVAQALAEARKLLEAADGP
ncbi:MAG: argininosuccinate lyase [Dehalococcoidia bacterium]|nr:argininosuccinate lyase [Dehalococcoidia bacterium]